MVRALKNLNADNALSFALRKIINSCHGFYAHAHKDSTDINFIFSKSEAYAFGLPQRTQMSTNQGT